MACPHLSNRRASFKGTACRAPTQANAYKDTALHFTRRCSKMSGMILTINGQSKTIADGSSLQAAVAALCKNPDLVIAELNGIIADRPTWAKTILNANDRLELITFVGGG